MLAPLHIWKQQRDLHASDADSIAHHFLYNFSEASRMGLGMQTERECKTVEHVTLVRPDDTSRCCKLKRKRKERQECYTCGSRGYDATNLNRKRKVVEHVTLVCHEVEMLHVCVLCFACQS